MKVGAQLYTVRERLGDPRRFREVLERLRQIGYAAVEVAGVSPQHAGEFAAAIRAADMDACAAHEPFADVVANLDEVAARCTAWGCDYVVVPGVPDEYHSADGFRVLGIELDEAAQSYRRHGLTLAYHNHAAELQRWSGKTGLETLHESASSGALKLELDTFWLEHAGAGAAEWIGRFAGEVPLVHLKDRSADGTQTEVGAGILDWPAILRACRAARVEWLVVEQDECPGDPFDSLASSYRNLTGLLSAW